MLWLLEEWWVAKGTGPWIGGISPWATDSGYRRKAEFCPLSDTIDGEACPYNQHSNPDWQDCEKRIIEVRQIRRTGTVLKIVVGYIQSRDFFDRHHFRA